MRRRRRARGLGAAPRGGRCCVVKNKRKIACFKGKREADAFVTAVRRTRGLRTFCFRKRAA